MDHIYKFVFSIDNEKNIDKLIFHENFDFALDIEYLKFYFVGRYNDFSCILDSSASLMIKGFINHYQKNVIFTVYDSCNNIRFKGGIVPKDIVGYDVFCSKIR